MYRTWGGEANSELCLICTEHGVERQKGTLFVIRNIKLQLQKFSLCLDRGDCSHCAEAGPRQHTDPVKHENLDDVGTNCKIQQLNCDVNIQGVEIRCVAFTSVQFIEYIADTSVKSIKCVADISVSL